ncbi:hypothetical protein C2S51_034768 [Perilla frutescens var. frutescens]|nr:hypothetical protein C2S51_034768 [Perilla frutescens var. frutescens]
MALKPFHLISFTFLIFLLLAPIGQAKRNTPSDKNSSPFNFIKKLKGCHKGNTTKGIHELKAYLQKFGYLEYLNKTNANDDDFDETLELAVKTYQENYHIKPTGTIDTETIAKMTTPRCGVPDIINGTNYMQPKKRKHDPSSSSIHTVSHYSFFPRSPKWPPTKTHLTYRLSPNFPTNAVGPVARAFQQWDSNTHFSFSRVQSNQNSDLVIDFHGRDVGDDDEGFDGPGVTAAHAWAPPDGRFHYDVDERWSSVPDANAYDLETVAVHEIGHLLGLHHSSVEAASMYAYVEHGLIKGLHEDDIQGIRALYNL